MSFKHVNVEQTLKLQTEGAVLVDIRDAHSYQIGHMQGALHLDNYSIADFITHADLDAPTIVICYHGISSQSAAAYLHSQGFENVFSMDGGYEAFQQFTKKNC